MAATVTVKLCKRLALTFFTRWSKLGTVACFIRSMLKMWKNLLRKNYQNYFFRNDELWQTNLMKAVDFKLKLKELKDKFNNNQTELENDAITNDLEQTERPWYFQNGTKYPKPAKVNATTKERIAKLMPSEDAGDRIEEQLMFVPPNYEQVKQGKKIKTILVYKGLHTWHFKTGLTETK